MADNDHTTARRKVAITNNDQGPRYVFTARGQEVIQPGQTLTTEATGAQIDGINLGRMEGSDAPMFTVERTDDDLDTGADKGKALAGLPVAQLRSVAEAEGVALTGRKDAEDKPLPDLTKAAEIIAAIEAHRQANASA